ncbi:universal stress protein [Parapedobacter sp. SGR-10]|uniref:universal stress protein n=1 Tax=Parapedobacter sp. SGR-10 TaxID=2710879 RepID=UPI0013D3B10C|nr:universal stress protein [Parapedobacter sp. SGR-10]NGF58107.1 universal stress protein [Parapedobacter sp. SGR-10]
MANKILIPVDFSEHSYKAIAYAGALNKSVYHDIDLVHVFTDYNDIYKDSQSNTDLIDPRVGSAKRDMQKIVSELVATNPELNVNVIFRDGNIYNEIRKLTAKNEYDAIVMGTKGSSGLDAVLSGSNMYDVFENTQVPVLAVPLTDRKIRLNKVGLLCNFKDGEIEVLKQAIRLLGKDFELILIHINTDNADVKGIDKKFKDFIHRIIQETGVDDISYVIKNQAFFIQYKENVSKSIDSVIEDEQIDLLLVTKSKKGFLRKVMEENIVRKMAYQIQIPKFFAKLS